MTLQWWQNCYQKSRHQGFTLLELLIVILILGVLAAIAVPALLAQVGKARETEAKTTLESFNRAQQAYFMEKGDFAITFADLDVDVDDQRYYDYGIGSLSAKGIALANGKDNGKNGTRSYASGVQYDRYTRKFDAILCRGNVAPDFSVLGSQAIQNNGIIIANIFGVSNLKCNPAKTEQVK